MAQITDSTVGISGSFYSVTKPFIYYNHLVDMTEAGVDSSAQSFIDEMESIQFAPIRVAHRLHGCI